jgi:hypothetical protein
VLVGVVVLLVLVGAYVVTLPDDQLVEPNTPPQPPPKDSSTEPPEPTPKPEDPKPEGPPAEGQSAEEKPEKAAPVEDEKAAIARVRGDVEAAVFSMTVSNVTIREALEKLSKETGIAIDVNRLSSEVLEGKISFSFDETPLADALQFICAIKGMKYEIGPRGIEFQ